RVTGADQVPPARKIAAWTDAAEAVHSATASPAASIATCGLLPAGATVTGALQVPPGVRTLACTPVDVAPEKPCHTATVRPFGATATAGSPPGPSVTGVVQVCPFALVETLTPRAPDAVCPDVMTAAAPEALTEATGDPSATGSGTGADHPPAACAGAAPATTRNAASVPAVSPKLRGEVRCIIGSPSLCIHGHPLARPSRAQHGCQPHNGPGQEPVHQRQKLAVAGRTAGTLRDAAWRS